MLYVSGVRYDPATRVMTVRLTSPSRVERVTQEYRDVSPALGAEVCAARPHWTRVLEAKVEPYHAVRRCGERTWRVPAPTDVDGDALTTGRRGPTPPTSQAVSAR